MTGTKTVRRRVIGNYSLNMNNNAAKDISDYVLGDMAGSDCDCCDSGAMNLNLGVTAEKYNDLVDKLETLKNDNIVVGFELKVYQRIATIDGNGDELEVSGETGF